MIRYEPHVLQQEAERLIKAGRTFRIACVVGALLVLLALLGTAVRAAPRPMPRGAAWLFEGGPLGPAELLALLLGALVFGALGWALGTAVAWGLRVRAQELLCRVQTERNTRPRAGLRSRDRELLLRDARRLTLQEEADRLAGDMTGHLQLSAGQAERVRAILRDRQHQLETLYANDALRRRAWARYWERHDAIQRQCTRELRGVLTPRQFTTFVRRPLGPAPEDAPRGGTARDAWSART